MTGSLEDAYETVEQAAARLGYGESTVRKWCAQGRFLCQKVGNQWFIPRGAIPGTFPRGEEISIGYMTVPQAAALWGWDRSTVLRLCYGGHIPGAVRKPFRDWLIPEDTPPPRRRPRRRPQRREVDS